MARIQFGGSVYDAIDGETVLECLERHGESIPSSCRSGVCQSCLMRATAGDPGAQAKRPLKETLQAQNYFLSCVCKPAEDLTVGLPDMAGLKVRGRIVEKSLLNARTVRLRYAVDEPLECRAGQFMNLVGPDGAVRSYSVASLPTPDGYIEFHIMLLSGGKVSGWAFHEAAIGDESDLLGPHGSCFYVPGRPEQPLLLIGTGTGLAPLYGIVRDALAQGHTAPIRLYHGALAAPGLYLSDELRELAERHPAFAYHPCVLHAEGATPDMTVGDIAQIALAQEGGLKGWRIFLCGDPNLVRGLQRSAFKAGAGLRDILADAFLPSRS